MRTVAAITVEARAARRVTLKTTTMTIERNQNSSAHSLNRIANRTTIKIPRSMPLLYHRIFQVVFWKHAKKDISAHQGCIFFVLLVYSYL